MTYIPFTDYIKHKVKAFEETRRPQKFKINEVTLVADGTMSSEQLGDYYIRNVNLNRVFT
jgi:hypothetical protein